MTMKKCSFFYFFIDFDVLMLSDDYNEAAIIYMVLWFVSFLLWYTS
jgi:hypothetical protein